MEINMEIKPGRCGFRKGNKIIIDGEVAYIHMERKITEIDVEDVERVKKYTWHYGKTGVATTTPRPSQTTIQLSRFILFGDKHKTDKRLADHKDHNILNNRKYNLRPATYIQNGYNQLPRKGTSQYKGVSWNKNKKKWETQIQANGIKIYLGLFTDEIKAAETYDKEAKKLHKEFAFLNFGERRIAV